MKQNIKFDAVETTAFDFNYDNTPIRVMPIPNHPDYFLGVDGNVYSTKQKKLKRLKTSLRNGYPYITLSTNGFSSVCYVHKLMGLVFLNDSDTDRDGNLRSEINHINGCKTNNKLANLERCSRKENMRHFFNVICA